MARDEVKDFHDLIAEVQTRGACGRCGGLGSPDGYTTVTVRTTSGERIYNGARRQGFIREMKLTKKEQALVHGTTRMATIVSFARRKQQRAAHVLGSE